MMVLKHFGRPKETITQGFDGVRGFKLRRKSLLFVLTLLFLRLYPLVHSPFFGRSGKNIIQ